MLWDCEACPTLFSNTHCPKYMSNLVMATMGLRRFRKVHFSKETEPVKSASSRELE